MGLFGLKHPELDPNGAVARSIGSHDDVFAPFAKSANDRIELVVDDGGPLYAFVGKPPKAFGLVWFEAGQRHDLRSMLETKAMTREAASQLVQELPAIYTRHASEERFAHKVAGKSVVVTASKALYDEVDQAVTRARSAS